jgi:hypothetical protein
MNLSINKYATNITRFKRGRLGAPDKCHFEITKILLGPDKRLVLSYLGGSGEHIPS